MAHSAPLTRPDPVALDGYVADESFPSGCDARFVPGWIDAILGQAGVAAPRAPRRPFTYVDLGCGDGAGLVLLAAAYPEARVIGIDALPAHIDRARALAAAAGLTNIEFRCATFAEASDLPRGCADYVALRGVVTWVSDAVAGTALDRAARLLRPGGVLAIGYNVLPAWTPVLAFQRLVFDCAAGLPGHGAARFDAAVAMLRAAGLIQPEVLAWLDEKRRRLPPGYFPHEYLNRHWQPVWSGDLIARAEGLGLAHAANADPGRQRPDFFLRKAERAALAALPGRHAREIATDIYLETAFRTDLFVKGPAAANPEARLRQPWRALCRADAARYELPTRIGRIRFDSLPARVILRHLEGRPRPLSTISGIDPADLIDALDALWVADLVEPAEPPAVVPHAAPANQAIGAAGGAGLIPLRAGAHGLERG